MARLRKTIRTDDPTMRDQLKLAIQEVRAHPDLTIDEAMALVMTRVAARREYGSSHIEMPLGDLKAARALWDPAPPFDTMTTEQFMKELLRTPSVVLHAYFAAPGRERTVVRMIDKELQAALGRAPKSNHSLAATIPSAAPAPAATSGKKPMTAEEREAARARMARAREVKAERVAARAATAGT